ncbi:aminoglycoside adenylyltransferase domain-containing protein [Paenibacillus sp. BK720]|uniref:aminoglycoside adenylyltransferase domain-containing protein n=1 Tax=Paenibacillus sp. BK720 TaxID=2587092 RepID=UPI001FBA0561|nr:aminoglycoside adenylyltransferase domain-containing protein [Paenibacillus sp. BK720]NIK69675.1 streptomycin 3'-adenylyltransferase [Paenibacillus sp. BK720]
MKGDMTNTGAFLQQAVSTFRSVLSDNLAGIYLHGSLAMGCYNPEKSDIDLIVVVKDKLSKEELKQITRHVLLLDQGLPGGNGIELSIILESYAREFAYPTPFEYHYSQYHRERYRSEPGYLCGGFEDPDIAAHFTVIYYRGKTLWGVPIPELFKPVESIYYIQTILGDISEASKEITDLPVYYSLNLCRVLFYLREGKVSSKLEGGEWGLRVLPSKYRPLLRACLDEYIGQQGNSPERDGEQLIEFAQYMLAEIIASG